MEIALSHHGEQRIVIKFQYTTNECSSNSEQDVVKILNKLNQNYTGFKYSNRLFNVLHLKLKVKLL